MRAIRITVGLLLLSAVVAGAMYLITHKKLSFGPDTRTEPETFIPDFSFPDRTGHEVSFNDVDARVRVVNFWASWSPYSASELPALARLKEEFGDDIEVVALNRDTNPNDGRSFIDSLNIPKGELIELYDQNDTYYRSIGGYNMPESVFVNSDGGVLVHIHGPMTYDDMKSTLEKLLQ